MQYFIGNKQTETKYTEIITMDNRTLWKNKQGPDWTIMYNIKENSKFAKDLWELA